MVCGEDHDVDTNQIIDMTIFIERIRVDTNVRNTQRQTDNGTENKWWMVDVQG